MSYAVEGDCAMRTNVGWCALNFIQKSIGVDVFLQI